MDVGIRSIDREPVPEPSGARRLRTAKEGAGEFRVALDPRDGRRAPTQGDARPEKDEHDADAQLAPRAEDEAGSHLDLTA